MPVRNPGQSLEEELQNLIEEPLMPLIFVAAYVVVLALLEWWRWFSSRPPQPILMSVIAVLTVLYVTYSCADLTASAHAPRGRH